MTDHRVKVDNGKYEFIQREDGSVDVLRHGEPWLQRCMPQNGIGSLMAELDAARVVVQAAREMVAAVRWRRERGDEFDARYFPLAEAEAIALHDRLVDDREPPSAWCAGAVEEQPGHPTRPASTLGLHDAVYDIISDALCRVAPRMNETPHRDECRRLTKQVLAAVAAHLTTQS